MWSMYCTYCMDAYMCTWYIQHIVCVSCGKHWVCLLSSICTPHCLVCCSVVTIECYPFVHVLLLLFIPCCCPSTPSQQGLSPNCHHSVPIPRAGMDPGVLHLWREPGLHPGYRVDLLCGGHPARDTHLCSQLSGQH